MLSKAARWGSVKGFQLCVSLSKYSIGTHGMHAAPQFPRGPNMLRSNLAAQQTTLLSLLRLCRLTIFEFASMRAEMVSPKTPFSPPDRRATCSLACSPALWCSL